MSWPDHGCPQNPEPVIRLVEDVDECVKRNPDLPILVHCRSEFLLFFCSLLSNTLDLVPLITCGTYLFAVLESAGQERTLQSTFSSISFARDVSLFALNSNIYLIFSSEIVVFAEGDCMVNIARTVEKMREQRQGMVQTEAQYTFIYKALAHFISNHLGIGRSEPLPSIASGDS